MVAVQRKTKRNIKIVLYKGRSLYFFLSFVVMQSILELSLPSVLQVSSSENDHDWRSASELCELFIEEMINCVRSSKAHTLSPCSVLIHAQPSFDHIPTHFLSAFWLWCACLYVVNGIGLYFCNDSFECGIYLLGQCGACCTCDWLCSWWGGGITGFYRCNLSFSIGDNFRGNGDFQRGSTIHRCKCTFESCVLESDWYLLV